MRGLTSPAGLASGDRMYRGPGARRALRFACDASCALRAVDYADLSDADALALCIAGQELGFAASPTGARLHGESAVAILSKARDAVGFTRVPLAYLSALALNHECDRARVPLIEQHAALAHANVAVGAAMAAVPIRGYVMLSSDRALRERRCLADDRGFRGPSKQKRRRCYCDGRQENFRSLHLMLTLEARCPSAVRSLRGSADLRSQRPCADRFVPPRFTFSGAFSNALLASHVGRT
jgi:hypothetical protein